MYVCASIKTLESLYLSCDARLIRAIWKAKDEEELFSIYPDAKKIAARGYHRPGLLELKKMCIDLAGEYHGVEYLGQHARTGLPVEYCNAGDTYAGTIAFIGTRLIVSTWGDLVESGRVKTGY